MRAKVLIVGGGVMGTSIALEAALHNDPLAEPVVLLERTHLGAGSSGRSGAILRQVYADREVAAMARDSLRRYASFEARVGRPIGFRRTGVLTLVGPDQKDWQPRLRDICARLTELGIRIELVDHARMRALVPGLQVRRGSIGAWEAEAGFVDPQLTVEAFAAQARTYGAITRLGVEVTEVLVKGGRVVGAATTEGEYAAESVVIVAGPWSGALLERLGISLPLRIVRPECHYLAMPLTEVVEDGAEIEGSVFNAGEDITRTLDPVAARQEPGAAGLHPVLIDLEKNFYCRCEPNTRRLRLGHTDYSLAATLEQPEPFDEEVSEETKRWTRAVATERLPEYAGQADAGSLAGWYTLTPDAQPVIGPLPGIEGLFVVSGFSGHGFKLAPSVGEGVAQMLRGEAVGAFDAGFFSPTRFRGDEPWGGRFGL